jgi:hypothetical protein
VPGFATPCTREFTQQDYFFSRIGILLYSSGFFPQQDRHPALQSEASCSYSIGLRMFCLTEKSIVQNKDIAFHTFYRYRATGSSVQEIKFLQRRVYAA